MNLIDVPLQYMSSFKRSSSWSSKIFSVLTWHPRLRTNKHLFSMYPQSIHNWKYILIAKILLLSFHNEQQKFVLANCFGALWHIYKFVLIWKNLFRIGPSSKDSAGLTVVKILLMSYCMIYFFNCMCPICYKRLPFVVQKALLV